MAVHDFVRSNLQHSAWGLAHAERDFLLAQTLARSEKLAIDEDVLFAAAFLHDVSVFPPYPKEGVDHTERSAQVAGDILRPMGFPMDKLAKVQEAMRSHMFYSKVGESPEAIVLHDADTLDFLGNIGIARILSLTTRHKWAPDMPGAISTLKKFRHDLPDKLITKSAQRLGVKRVMEMDEFLRRIKAQSNEGKAL